MPISEINSTRVPVKLWVPLSEADSNALDQLKRTANLPWVFSHVCAMPDMHHGKGATVGSVIAMENAVSPSAVGVDIGCVDKDTEYLSPEGWKKLSDYDGSLVMQYDPETEVGSFVEPEAFIKLPCEEFLRIKTKYGVDQMLSAEHKVLYAKYDRSYKFDKFDTVRADELARRHNSTKQGFRGRFLTTFKPDIRTSVDLTDAQLRVAVMAAADGNFVSRGSSTRCRLRLKKQRKIDRAQELLTAADLVFETEAVDDGVTQISFYAPLRMKSLGSLWEASLFQLRLIADEVIQWDGNKENRCFYTRDKASADFIHYVFAALGFRSVLREDAHPRDGKIDYRVFFHYNVKIGINGSKRLPIESVPSEDGFKYCFTLPTGYWVMRRGGNIVITGNCGMAAVKTSLTASHLPESLREIRSKIEDAVPVGFASHPDPVDGVDRLPIWQNFRDLDERAQKLRGKALAQCGTLGGGNHFIEICLDEADNVWIMLHSGSRNIGKTLAEIHIKRAKKLAHNSELPDPDLAVFLAGTEEMEHYRHDLFWAQNYALNNRRVMLKLVKGVLGKFFPGISYESPVECHHNYCISKGSIVEGPGYSKPIEDVKEGDVIYGWSEEGLRSVTVKRLAETGEKSIVRVITNGSTLEVTPDHQVLTMVRRKVLHPTRSWHSVSVPSFVWKDASDLTSGEIVVVSTNNEDCGEEVDPDYAQLLGAFVGDGWVRQITKRGHDIGLAVGGETDPHTDYYLTLLRRFFPQAVWKNNASGTFGLTSSSKEARRSLIEAGCVGASNHRRLPKKWATWNRASRLGLLAGYLDADGTAVRTGYLVRTAVRDLAFQLHSLARGLGFWTTGIRFSHQHTNFGEGDEWAFKLTASFDELPTSRIFTQKPRASRRNRTRGLITTGSVGRMPKVQESYGYERVRKIEDAGVMNTYDVVLDTPEHAFICNGVVVHNCAEEHHYGADVFVTRKGAIRARKNDLGIIPGSMGTRSYIVRGLGNAESFESASHGAGRRMSRNKAKKQFTQDDLKEQTKGIECRKDRGVLDEIPGAYKDIDQVMANQSDLVEVQAKLRQILCVKG